MHKIFGLLLVFGLSGCSLNSVKEENRNTLSMNKCCGCENMTKCQTKINPATGEKEVCCSKTSCSCPDTKNLTGNFHAPTDTCGNCH